ncbi:hypothetical protein, partial [Thiolapillus sp.]|uniref:hypothetical protein n=1 Tax=Thiolapillus sp. TaxID=2017437 RepID=UPI003AF722FB
DAAFGGLLCFPSGAMRTTGKQCSLAATGDCQPSLRSPWLAATAQLLREVDQRIGKTQPSYPLL